MSKGKPVDPKDLQAAQGSVALFALAAALKEAMAKGYCVTLEPAGDPRAWRELAATALGLIHHGVPGSTRAEDVQAWRAAAAAWRAQYQALQVADTIAAPGAAPAAKE